MCGGGGVQGHLAQHIGALIGGLCVEDIVVTMITHLHILGDEWKEVKYSYDVCSLMVTYMCVEFTSDTLYNFQDH